MTRNELFKLLALDTQPGPPIEIDSITEDSRRVMPGAAFVALRGQRVDGFEYADEAVRKGAVTVIGEEKSPPEINGVPYIRVDNARHAAGVIAHALAGNPSRDMTVIGITGTNGKGSVAFLAQAVLQHAGIPTANFGTTGYDIGAEILQAPHTTPFAEQLAGIFSQAKEAGKTHVAMEVASHALEQSRVAGIAFDVAAFTNLTQDHLDYHHSMEEYREAKLKLFDLVDGPDSFTVVNLDDPSAAHFLKRSKIPGYTFGREGDCQARNIQTRMDGTSFALTTPWGSADVNYNLLGEHNVSNALCASAICGGLGIEVEGIAEGLAALPNVPGRFEPVHAGQNFPVVVDYAHTEDGLRNVLKAARRLCTGRLILVFGCGGDRDKGKRPKMGAAAAQLSDFWIVTSDNPRTEDPHRILLDIEVGVQSEGKRKHDDYLVIEPREEAIRTAIGMAERGDMVLIAGKGHEDYQILGTSRIHFDDREVARAILEGN